MKRGSHIYFLPNEQLQEILEEHLVLMDLALIFTKRIFTKSNQS